ncbi:hypothetical protein JCM8547_007862 [Rhodosporidiobolus lusitaniae]
MAPAASKSKAYSTPVATQADDAKYRSKYKELKGKVQEIEEDNTKLSVKILKSKKTIQRLRIERAILYDRLQQTTAPTNPYALSSATHLSNLASSSDPSSSTSAGLPPSILSKPSYPLADPGAPDLFLKQLDAQKLAALQHQNGSTSTQFGEQPAVGVAGEGRGAMELAALLAPGGEQNGAAEGAANGQQAGPTAGGAYDAAHPTAAAPQAAPAPHLHQSAMQVDQA